MLGLGVVTCPEISFPNDAVCISSINFAFTVFFALIKKIVSIIEKNASIGQFHLLFLSWIVVMMSEIRE